jgi:hypothetical protein
MGGGAWPFLVRGLICLVNSDNERDLDLLVGAGSGWFTGGVGQWRRRRLVLWGMAAALLPHHPD